MTSIVPEGCISLTQAFDRFRLMRHGSVPDWLDEPPSDLTQVSDWEKQHLRTHREDLAELFEAFSNGQLKAFVWPKREAKRLPIQTGELMGTRSPEDLFLEELIFVLSGDSLADYKDCRPFVDEIAFSEWLEANDPDAIHAERQRWGLLATLAWIATREITLSRLADQAGNTLNSIDILLRDWALKVDSVRSKTWPYRTASEAWERELVPTLSAGKLKASAARTVCYWGGNSEQTELGQTFPPDEAAAAAEHHIIREGKDGPILFPDGAQGAQRWAEWSRLVFDRDTMMQLWPKESHTISQDAPRTISRRNVRKSDLRESVTEVVLTLWPHGCPAGLKAKERNLQIRHEMTRRGLSCPSDRTIVRAMSDVSKAAK